MYYTMLPLIAALLLALHPVSSLAADSLAVRIRPHGLQAGNRAVLFEIGDFLKVKAFQGMGIALKHQHSGSRATRLTLDIELYQSRGVYLQDDLLNDTIQEEYRSDHYNTTRALTADLLRLDYRKNARAIHTYWGWGPLFSVSRTERSYDTYRVEVGQVRQSSSPSMQTQLAGGLKSVLGVEWFATREISLHAEYGLTLVRSRTWNEGTIHVTTYNSDNVTTETSSNESNSLELEPIPVVFGLSVYF